MAKIVRAQTTGKADDLHEDLLTNLANPELYDDPTEYSLDLELFTILNLWIRQQRIINEERTDFET